MTAVTETRTWTLTLPAPTIHVPDRKPGRPKPAGGWPKKPAAGWLTMNSRMDWRAAMRLKRQWWELAAAAAMAARLPVGQVTRARFDATVHLTAGARRGEPMNWHPTAKVVVDAICAGTKTKRGYGFLPDDAPRFLHCPECPHISISPERVPVEPFKPLGVLVFTVTDLSEIKGDRP